MACGIPAPLSLRPLCTQTAMPSTSGQSDPPIGKAPPALAETSEGPAPQPPLAERSWLGMASSIISTLLFITLLATLVVAYPMLQARAGQLQAAAPSVQFSWPPLAGLASAEPAVPGGEPRTWVNAEIRSDLERLVLKRLSSDPFDHDGLNAAREDLLRTGWITSDLTLIRQDDGVVRVSGTWRVPVAAVRFNDRDHLVTRSAELLPLSYAQGSSGFKVILGVPSPPPEPGKVWLGGEVQAGLKLLAHLAAVQGVHQIASVDTTEFATTRSLTIVTDLGNRILWGGPVDAFSPGQAPTTTKLARLSRLFREHGRVDAGRAVLDVRLADGVYVHDTAGVLARAESQAADAPQSRQGDRVRR